MYTGIPRRVIGWNPVDAAVGRPAQLEKLVSRSIIPIKNKKKSVMTVEELATKRDTEKALLVPISSYLTSS